jgi:hypothetical protein
MMARHACPCCACRTLEPAPPGTFEICPVCWWEDDNVQFENPRFAGGANSVSLEEARSNYRAFGASEKGLRDRVRAPTDDELASLDEGPARG